MAASRGDAAQLPPSAKVDGGGLPAVGNVLQLGGVEPQELRESVPVHRLGCLAGVLEGGQFGGAQRGGLGGGFRCDLLVKAFLGDDVADVIFKLHGGGA